MIHFKIGITFSGRYRSKYVEPICNELLLLGYSIDDIFYDRWHDVLINGVRGDKQLRRIYSENCDCVVVLLSPDYKERHWTGNVEWRSIEELINTGGEDKICLLSIDMAQIGNIDGLYQYQDIAKPIDGLSIREIAEFIDRKYKLIMEGQDTYTGSGNKTISKYIKPEFFRGNLLGIDIRPEWLNYIKDLTDKLIKYIEYYGVNNPHYEDGMEWYVSRYTRNGILIMQRYDIESEKNPHMGWLYVYINYEASDPNSGDCVFGLCADEKDLKLTCYIPGEWDDEIFSWP